MFKKLVSHLKFSPSLIGELADLAVRLRKQTPIRVVGVILVGLLLIGQLTIIAYSTKNQNMSYAGSMFFDSSIEITDISNQLKNDRNSIATIFSALNIDKTSINQSSLIDMPSLRTEAYRISRWPVDKSSLSIQYSQSGTVYASKITPEEWSKLNSVESPFITGTTKDSLRFFISTVDGAMYLEGFSTESRHNTSIKLSLDYLNTSTNNTEPVAAKPGDRIKITLHATNTSNQPLEYTFKLPMGDALEYVDIDKNSNQETTTTRLSEVLVWDQVKIPSNTTVSKDVILNVKSKPSTLPLNTAHPYSQDCLITVIHGGQIDIPIRCSLQKDLEMITRDLPKISQGILLLWTAILFITSLIILIKSLIEEEEIRLIRHKFNRGT